MKRSECSFTSFKELKKALEGKKQILKGDAVGKTKPPGEESDEEIFHKAMADVREIKEFREIPAKGAPRITPRSVRDDADVHDTLRQIVDGKKRIRLSDTGEYMEWTSAHIRKDITKRLHEGGFSVQDSIDLHGMTLREAEEAVREFLAESVRRRLFCVKVIHGRGLRSPRGPVLKEALKVWLHGPFRKWVLAYVTARDLDGGLGATYIILK